MKMDSSRITLIIRREAYDLRYYHDHSPDKRKTLSQCRGFASLLQKMWHAEADAKDLSWTAGAFLYPLRL